MKRLTPTQWSRFLRLRRLYPDLTQRTLAERFGISLDTAKAHWHDAEAAVPAESPPHGPAPPSTPPPFPLSRSCL